MMKGRRLYRRPVMTAAPFCFSHNQIPRRICSLSAISSRTFTWRFPAKSSKEMMKLYNERRTDKSDLADLKRTAQFI